MLAVLSEPGQQASSPRTSTRFRLAPTAAGRATHTHLCRQSPRTGPAGWRRTTQRTAAGGASARRPAPRCRRPRCAPPLPVSGRAAGRQVAPAVRGPGYLAASPGGTSWARGAGGRRLQRAQRPPPFPQRLAKQRCRARGSHAGMRSQPGVHPSSGMRPSPGVTWMRCPKCLNMVVPPDSEMLPSSARRVSMGQRCTTESITSGRGVRQSARPGGSRPASGQGGGAGLSSAWEEAQDNVVLCTDPAPGDLRPSAARLPTPLPPPTQPQAPPPEFLPYSCGLKKISGPRKRSRRRSTAQGAPPRDTPSYRRVYRAGSASTLSASRAGSARVVGEDGQRCRG